ncbi:MAG TPA: DsrH/TusB family sulfur metabolism protein [Xanthomonadales bacterium]|nr:DsrH/TusB family sulfur metabolism protein [Xanthomonadales bacterium]
MQVPSNPAGKCLHLLLSHATDTLNACLQHAQAGDSVILLNTAVLLLMDPAFRDKLPENIHAYVLDADVQAHGLTGIQPSTGTELVNDDDWVGLVMSHVHCLSWK